MSVMATSIGDEIASSGGRTTWFTVSLAVTLDPRVFASSLSEETNRISDRIVFQKRIVLNRQAQKTGSEDADVKTALNHPAIRKTGRGAFLFGSSGTLEILASRLN